MANRHSDPLFSLVKSLTKAEKRHFRLYANRAGNGDSNKFMRLFDILDRQSTYDEEVIFRKDPGLKRSQLSNLKAHLYKQLLTALRLLHLNHDSYLQLREQIDQARILYTKGLYRQSLKLLDRAKATALEGFPPTLLAEIVEFEKQIAAHHITQNLPSRSEELTRQSAAYIQYTRNAAAFSTLSLQMFALFVRNGHIRNEADHLQVRTYFNERLPECPETDLDFFGKMYRYQAYFWYYFMQLDFPLAYRHAAKWADLFETEPDSKLRYSDLYIKSLHNLLSISFNMLRHTYFRKAFRQLTEFGQEHESRLSVNDRTNLQAYLITHQINASFMTGTFSEGARLIPKLELQLKEIESQVDENRITLIYYKIACLYFGSGDNINAIRYLNLIINSPRSDVRVDLHCFARILSLIAHFELGNDLLVQYQVRSVYRFLIRMDSLQEVQKEIFRFLRSLPKISRDQLGEAFVKLRDKLIILEQDPYLSRPFLYLDIISWLESKIQNRPVEAIIFEKSKGR